MESRGEEGKLGSWDCSSLGEEGGRGGTGLSGIGFSLFSLAIEFREGDCSP